MKAEEKVREVYPEAICEEVVLFGSRRFRVRNQLGGRKTLALSNQRRWAWAEAWREIERKGVPTDCPRCGTRLEPFEGEEDGPVTSWSHPFVGNGCLWDEVEGLTPRHLAAAKRQQRSST
jgi:hypothetical protein